MTQAKSLNIICAGECMVELRQAIIAETDEAQYASSFAGDVTNFSVY
jgi:hypothetical protein